MGRRKKKNNNIVYFITAFVILIIGLIFYNFDFSKKIETITKNDKTQTTSGENTEAKNNNENYYANSKIEGTGQLIIIPYDIKIGTKYKLKLDNKEFFAKSDKYLLDNYVDKSFTLSGTIIGFSPDNTPVINIENIKENENTEQEEKEQVDNNIYLKNLVLNFSGTDLLVQTGNDNIVIYKTGDLQTGNVINLVKIESFKCEKGNYLYDCDGIKKQAKTFQFKTFTSNNGIKFYSLPESDQYVVLGKEYGYNFFPLSGDIYSIINYISFKKDDNELDVKKTKFNLNETIKNTCKNDKIELTDIIKVAKTKDNYTVKGLDKFANNIICKLSIQDGEMKVAKLESLDFVKDNTNITGNVLENNEIYETKYLVYKSRGYGFILYMSKAVKYKSILIKNSLGVAGLLCVQQVNIADWKSGTLTDPELKVLYCKTKLDIESLDKLLEGKRSNYKIQQINGKTFIILYKDTEKAENILNNLIIK